MVQRSCGCYMQKGFKSKECLEQNNLSLEFTTNIELIGFHKTEKRLFNRSPVGFGNFAQLHMAIPTAQQTTNLFIAIPRFQFVSQFFLKKIETVIQVSFILSLAL